MVRRWQQLPLDRALAHVPQVLGVLQEIVDATPGSPAPGTRLPDLGPAVIPEQLRVVVHDARNAAFAASPDQADCNNALATLADRLTVLRRGLP